VSARAAIRAAGIVAALAIALTLLNGGPIRPPHPVHVAGRLRVEGLELRSVRSGRGPTVVLLHGYGESLMSWRGVFDRLAKDADVMAIDLPGFGLSSKPAHGYSTEAMARVVIGALDAAAIDSVVLVGHSMGGAIAAAAALLAPQRVRRLVLIDPAGVAPPLGLASARDTAGAVIRASVAEYEAQRTRFTSPHDPTWLAEAPAVAAYLPAADSAYRTALTSVLREFDFAFLTVERMRALHAPTLVIWGEFDPVVPLSQGRALVSSLPSATLIVIARSWHRPQVERPAETAAAIAAFLARRQ
jgi:pimeloyl-ACP methyl ester carboxylesterase